MKHLGLKSTIIQSTIAVVLASVLSLGLGPFASRQAYGAELLSRSLEISNSGAGSTNVIYNISFTLATVGSLGSIAIQFCSNSTFITDPCNAPSGLDMTNSAIASQSGATGFTKSAASTANVLVLTRPSTVSLAVPVNMTFNQITNPSANGSYYVRVLTYASSDTSGQSTDSGGMAFVIQNSIAVGVSTEVPPYLTFCVADVIASFTHDCSTATGSYIDLGDFDGTHTSMGTTQFVTATNAQSGYSVYVQGNTPTSGNNVIPSLVTPSASQTGNAQFGINLRSNTNPSTGNDPTGPGNGSPVGNYNLVNRFTYNSGDTIASSSAADDFRLYTVSYIVNVDKSQPVGVYASTFTYICLANF